MRDPDERDFFKSLKQGKKSYKKSKEYMKNQNSSFNPVIPFTKETPSPFSTPPAAVASAPTPAPTLVSTPLKQWEEPRLPIDVVKEKGYREWEWSGVKFRPYYDGNLWLNCDASLVYSAFHDHNSDTITYVKRLDVKIDEHGKQYVENTVNKVWTKVFLDDALRATFRTGLAPVPPQTAPMIHCVKRNPRVLTHGGVDYSYYHDGKFCVSRDGNHACWMYIHWDSTPLTFGRVVPYTVKTSADGRKYVDVKQPDGQFKDFDMATAVATTFYQTPPSPGWTLKFRDGDISNCDADNLYWSK